MTGQAGSNSPRRRLNFGHHEDVEDAVQKRGKKSRPAKEPEEHAGTECWARPTAREDEAIEPILGNVPSE